MCDVNGYENRQMCIKRNQMTEMRAEWWKAEEVGKPLGFIWSRMVPICPVAEKEGFVSGEGADLKRRPGMEGKGTLWDLWNWEKNSQMFQLS